MVQLIDVVRPPVSAMNDVLGLAVFCAKSDRVLLDQLLSDCPVQGLAESCQLLIYSSSAVLLTTDLFYVFLAPFPVFVQPVLVKFINEYSIEHDTQVSQIVLNRAKMIPVVRFAILVRIIILHVAVENGLALYPDRLGLLSLVLIRLRFRWSKAKLAGKPHRHI